MTNSSPAACEALRGAEWPILGRRGQDLALSSLIPDFIRLTGAAILACRTYADNSLSVRCSFDWAFSSTARRIAAFASKVRDRPHTLQVEYCCFLERQIANAIAASSRKTEHLSNATFDVQSSCASSGPR